jgi:uncharacterized membrane-anchored protein
MCCVSDRCWRACSPEHEQGSADPLAFWVMKICATTLGETAGDLLSMTLSVGYAVNSVISPASS